MTDLLPCPFCGGKGEFTFSDCEDDGEICYPNCDRCGCEFHDGPVGIGWYANKAAAAAIWNTRTHPPKDAGPVAWMITYDVYYGAEDIRRMQQLSRTEDHARDLAEGKRNVTIEPLYLAP